MQQQAGGGLVDVLGGGDDLGAVASDLHHDRDVVGAVAGKPVELVADDVSDVALFEAREKGLESGPVGRLSGLAAIEELATSS